ncbi:MAG TPA: hypothetical protein VI912_02920 [Candidatus Bilamarchaeaceae archaeon]|nr:hypothetical protein [Candidatus Bilamarchaeaceae archaeon]
MKKILILILLINLLFPTTLFGEIFDAEDFSKLNNTIIKIEGDTTIQVTVDGNYSLELPEGNYTLTASYYEEGKLKYYTKEELNLNQEIMQFDLVLLPEELRNILPEDLQTDENKTDTNNGNTNGDNKETDYTPFIIAFVLGTIIFVVGYFFIQKKQKEVEPEDDDKINEELDDDCKKVLKILGENEGRMNQKEIRDILNFSETKMSLVVAELETVKKIKKIKKGRQNILKLIN